jgi:calcineurin-like phosphoesterase family protein
MKTQRHRGTETRTRAIRDLYLRAAASLCLCAFVFSFALVAGPQGNGQRIVAVGDIHGDLDAFVGILQRAHVIDPMNRWSGGHATLIQTGDFLDRGPKAREVMDLLMSLQRDSQRQGGRVIVLMGNHEAMNIFGDLRFNTKNDYDSFADDRPDTRKPKTDASKPTGFLERCEAFGPLGKYGKWLRSLPAIARINDSIFLHGGIRPELASYSIDQLNEMIATEIKTFDGYRQFLVDKKIAQPCSSFDEMTTAARAAQEKAKGRDAETLKAFLGIGGWLSVSEDGPLWFRGYAEWTDAEGAPQVQQLVDKFDVARFIVGHTPQLKGQIVSRFDGKVYLIDTGMLSSSFAGGRASALNIQDGKINFIY